MFFVSQWAYSNYMWGKTALLGIYVLVITLSVALTEKRFKSHFKQQVCSLVGSLLGFTPWHWLQKWSSEKEHFQTGPQHSTVLSTHPIWTSSWSAALSLDSDELSSAPWWNHWPGSVRDHEVICRKVESPKVRACCCVAEKLLTVLLLPCVQRLACTEHCPCLATNEQQHWAQTDSPPWPWTHRV